MDTGVSHGANFGSDKKLIPHGGLLSSSHVCALVLSRVLGFFKVLWQPTPKSAVRMSTIYCCGHIQYLVVVRQEDMRLVIIGMISPAACVPYVYPPQVLYVCEVHSNN